MPGDKLAVIEEFNPGIGTYTIDDIIRALRLGIIDFNIKKRQVRVKSIIKEKKIPIIGDSIIGQVEMVQSNIANIKIYYINNIENHGGFTGMLLTKSANTFKKNRKKSILIKPGDIVRARVTSDLNGIIHLSIDDEKNGVLYASCSLCGNYTERFNNKIKCTICDTIEDRKLANDFSKVNLSR